MFLYDTTLRDGAQGQSVTFSLQDKEQILQRLDEVGMHFIEAGNPASNPKDAELYERLRTWRPKHARLVAFGSTHRVGVRAHEDAGLNVLAASDASARRSLESPGTFTSRTSCAPRCRTTST